MGSEPKFAQPEAGPAGATHCVAAKSVSDPNNPLVGGTSPFGTRKAMPVYIEESIRGLPAIAINGGRRGYLVGIAPQNCVTLLGEKSVHCALIE